MKNVTKQDQIIGLKDFRLNTQSFIDKVAKGESFIVVKRSRPTFRLEPVDEQWETVVDFTKIQKNGVPATDVLKAIDELNNDK